ncbi:PorP/SprF family type IX secretion system membrane protein [bacterium]|nr:PorP/SprF family type IX secretion system membrane protein [bacterium]
MKRIVLIAFALSFTFVSKAQQDPQWTHFMYDKLSYNPASAGFADAWCLTAITRKQWTGFNAGEPSTTLINFTTPTFSKLKGGFGFTYYNDQIAWETNNTLRFSYSLHLKDLGVKIAGGDLGIGLSASYNTKVINADWVTPGNTPSNLDVAIPVTGTKDAAMTFNAGLYYQHPSSLYIGISTTNLSQTQLTDLNLDGVRHYYVMGGYDYTLPTNFDLVLRANALMKSDAVKTQYDLNLNVLVFSRFWLGATYRHEDALAPMAGIEWNGFKLGYSYGIGTSFLSNYYSNGNHELMINYCFKITPPVRYQREVHPYLL